MKNRLIFWSILIVGILVRIVALGSAPCGLNQDEAYAGYEAWSMLHYGMDSHGYVNPVYFISWGDGMNVLNSYLMIPFIALFGLKVWVIRIPQCIIACCSIAVFYDLFYRVTNNKKLSLFAMFMLMICPWHIMLSRWGLESNLAPGFLLLGVYFLIRGLENNKYYILSGLFYGIALYAYATIWPIVPLIILLELIYLIWVKKIKFNGYLIGATIILFVLALPLMLFLLVQYGYTNEIRLSFISIPKMWGIRESINLREWFSNFKTLMKIILFQVDGCDWNSTYRFGLYYRYMVVFALPGGCILLYRLITSIKNRIFSGSVFVLINLFGAILLGCIIPVNINRVNCLHMPFLTLIIIGIYEIIILFKDMQKYTWPIVIAGMLSLFIGFNIYYHSEYQNLIGYWFQDGLDDAVEKSILLSESNNTDIAVSDKILFPKVWVYTKQPTDEVVASFWNENRCGGWIFNQYNVGEHDLYIISAQEVENYENFGYMVELYNSVAVAYR